MNVRTVQSPIDFKWHIEEEKDGVWQPLQCHTFGTIDDAKAWFERAKKAKRVNPAMLGNWNDA